ncbi:MAG: FAD-dependent oxidoreductase [Mogibacterium sp.]|nr:FAD-dependent oxidoreductase [Mogibacterium sp.]
MADQYDIIIVGGGPAGLTAGIYAGRAGKRVAILERELIGGQITYTNSIDNFPAAPGISGFEYAMRLQQQAESFGAKVLMRNVTEIVPPETAGAPFRVLTARGEYEATAVILATGLSHRRMGIEGEDALISRGISFCAVCDGAFFRKADVAVYGGGNTALEDAIFLSGLCNKVTIIHRRDRFRGEQQLVDELKSKENVEFAMQKTVSAVHGDKILRSITIKDTVTGEETDLPISGLFVAIGQIPNGGIFRAIAETDERGYYLADERCETMTPGLFVAGDGRSKEIQQLTTAVSDGAVAATKACKYVDRMNGNEYV